MRKVILYILTIAGGSNLAGQDLRFDRLLVEDGMTSVNAILIDHFGYRWFGGIHGLYRYDGINHEIFRHKSLDSNSLSCNDVIVLFEDASHNIWIGTFQGGAYQVDTTSKILHRFVYDLHKNSLSNSHILDIEEGQEGYLWLATGGGGGVCTILY